MYFYMKQVTADGTTIYFNINLRLYINLSKGILAYKSVSQLSVSYHSKAFLDVQLLSTNMQIFILCMYGTFSKEAMIMPT
jgi:hypothetical protein